MNTQEETYTLSDAEHVNNSNRYEFTYSPHWRRTNGKSLSIMIRSVKQILSTRAIWIDGLKLSNGTSKMDIGPDISLSGSWTKLNEQLNAYRYQQFKLYKDKVPDTTFNCEDYVIAYDENNSSLNIIANQNSSEDGYYLLIEKDANISNDLVSMCNIVSQKDTLMKDLHELSYSPPFKGVFMEKYKNEPIEIGFNSKDQIIRITFKNIWNRDTLAIHASFVDLSYHQWLGVANELYIPPKEYPITFDDQKFFIDLFTLDGRQVELPHDNKDQIIIEAMMNSYV